MEDVKGNTRNVGEEFKKRVEDAAKDEKIQALTTEFVDSIMELSKELMRKAKEGQKLTPAEDNFINKSAIFLMHGVLAALERRAKK